MIVTDCFSFMSANGMGWMMWGAGLFWLLVLALPILGAAALRADRRSILQ